MDKLYTVMIHIPEMAEGNGVGFHRSTQNGTHLKTYELFISQNFQVIFLDQG